MSARVPEQEQHVIDVSDACYQEIRRALVAAGTGGIIVDRGTLGRTIAMNDVVIRSGYKTTATLEPAYFADSEGL